MYQRGFYSISKMAGNSQDTCGFLEEGDWEDFTSSTIPEEENAYDGCKGTLGWILELQNIVKGIESQGIITTGAVAIYLANKRKLETRVENLIRSLNLLEGMKGLEKERNIFLDKNAEKLVMK